MYLPGHFCEDRVEVLHAFIEQHPLGALIAGTSDGLSADHVPILLERGRGELGALHGHVARANRIWRAVPDGADVLVLFGGADAYVSPSWYATKKATGEVVPTWNYAVVHARGRIRYFDDAERLLALVSLLTDRFEREQPAPWTVSDAPESYVQALLQGIVGFEIEILELTGKFKASQNRSEEDRSGVRTALQRRYTAGELEELVRDPRK